jgi:hypothetical protein
MEPSRLRFLLWGFIAALDSGKYDKLDIEEVRRHADARTTKQFLVDRFGKDLDLSLLDANDWAFIDETWANIANAVDARRKFGVERKGISLLMAYTLESMQMMQRQGQK